MDVPLCTTTAGPDSRSEFNGSIDGIEDGLLTGWAITGQGRPCDVSVTVNGRYFPAVHANLPRPDLGPGSLGGWRLAIGDALCAGENRIEARLPNGDPLQQSPAVFMGLTLVIEPPIVAGGAPLRYLGAIDRSEPPMLSGWALSSACRAVPINIWVAGRDPILVQSIDPRPDLAAKGLTLGDGGWHIDIAALLGLGPTIVHLRFPDGSDLPGSPLSFGTADRRVAVPPRMPLAPAPVPVKPPSTPDAPTPARLTVRRSNPPRATDFDDISLDQIALAVQAGRIQVAAPQPPPLPETNQPLIEEAAAPPMPPRKGVLSRLFGR